MWKGENLQGEYISLDQIIESLELEKCNQFVGALLDYSDIEDCMINRDFNCIKNNKKTWMEISYALSGLLEIDYTPQGNLQRYADEIYDLAKFRIENNVSPESDFTIPELIKEVEEKISVFKKLLLKLKLLDPKTIEETADSFIEKGESEYQKIMDKTATNYVEKAIENCVPSSNSSGSYSLSRVAKISNESEETIKNFCKLNSYYADDIDLPNRYAVEILKFMNPDGTFTEAGKDHIVAVYSLIKNTEKGMKTSSLGKAE